MIRKIAVLFAAIFLLMSVMPVFSQTEDEIVAQYLKKTEKKQKEHKGDKVIFVSANFSYGKLPNNNPYNKFYTYANANITNLGSPEWPMIGIWRSKQLGLNAGIMINRKLAFKTGFEYWLKMGSNTSGNFEFNIGPLGVQDNFEVKSEIKVYGFNTGFDYYLLNPPDQKGNCNSLALRLGTMVGYYMASWDVWSGSSSFNLATQTYDENTQPLKGSGPGFTFSLGADYPLRFLGLIVSAQAEYLILNLTNVHGYNNVGEELYLTYSENSNDRVNLDFSGPRARMELKKFFHF